MKYKKLLSFAAGLLILEVAVLACPPATLPPGGRWEANANCTFGPNFQTLTPTRERCHCWGHCGYICTPSDSSSGSGGNGSNSTSSTTTRPSTTRSTTARSTTTRSTTVRSTTTASTSTLTSNITSSASTSTTTRSTTSKKPITTRTTTTRKTTTTTASNGSPCPLGGVWFNPDGQRCRCQTLNQQSFYICEATTSSSPSTTTSPTTTVVLQQ